MLAKLKYLKAYFTRDILPLVGNPVGEILYTAKNTTGRRQQFVVDVDAKTVDITTINADPADPKTKPGAILVRTVAASYTDHDLYIFGGATLPVIASIVQAEFSQEIANGGAIDPINVLTGVTIDNVAATTGTATITLLAANGLTLNTGTGAVTLDDNLTDDTYTLDYKVEDINEPSVYITGTITVIVDPV